MADSAAVTTQPSSDPRLADVRVLSTPEALAASAADVVADAVADRPDLVLLLPLGDTPRLLFGELARRVEAGALDLSRVRLAQLDDYVVPEDDHRALFQWLRREVIEPLHLRPPFVRLSGGAADLDAACDAYERQIEELGGLDLAVLGLGPNGHVGFNEPPTEPDARTRVVDLTPESVRANARYWGGEEHVPRRGITAGLGLLLQARHVVLLVSGAHKRDILARTLYGPETPDVPASFLGRAPRLTVLADADALPDPHGARPA